jgi:GDPmannose 4,6-dehydratase
MDYIENYVTLHNIDNIYIYNLAAQSFVELSFQIPETTVQYDAVGVLNILECIRRSKFKNKIRFYQASSSEMFGKVKEVPQNEETEFYPRSPYGCSKVFAYWLCKNYRESYNLFICNGILFNHESPRRGDMFVTKKITKGVARIIKGDKTPIYLGNINSIRDWGHSKDYVNSMYLILNHNTPDDWVVSSGVTHTVRDFVEAAFNVVNIKIIWQGTGVNEVGINSETNEVLIAIDSKFIRPAEVDLLYGNSNKIRNILHWEPDYKFEDLVKEMVEYDITHT